MLPTGTRSSSGEDAVANSKPKNLMSYTKVFYLSLLVMAATLIVSTVVVNEESFKEAIVGRLSGFSSQKGEKAECRVTKSHCKKNGAEALPKGIVVETSDLQLRSLVEDMGDVPLTKNLLAMAVGIKQKQSVKDIVEKFPLSNFTIMLFHYDGVVDQWHDLSWSNQSIHIVGFHQTKWWFAKRFMHPSIVAQYNYIFLWDEDLGVEHFRADKYLEIMKAEGFEISQPALDPASSRIHHTLTRRQNSKRAHTIVMGDHVGAALCNNETSGPPCTGFVEVMAPVFSKAAWRCIWHMIQNDLVHAWGVDMKCGYCAQGVRREKVGVIDAEYVLHKGIPSLGAAAKQNGTTKDNNLRGKIKEYALREGNKFIKRWNRAAEEDAAWTDPYTHKNDTSQHY